MVHFETKFSKCRHIKTPEETTQLDPEHKSVHERYTTINGNTAIETRCARCDKLVLTTIRFKD